MLHVGHMLREVTAAPPAEFSIANSCMFDQVSLSYMTRLPSTDSTELKKFAAAFWFKSVDPLDGQRKAFLAAGGSNVDNIELYTDNELIVSWRGGFGMRAPFFPRDPSAWTHVFIKVDTTEALEADRGKCWVNGVQLDVTNNFGANTETARMFRTTSASHIGRLSNTGQYFDGLMAEFHVLDGDSADIDTVAVSDFGEFDANDVWQPKAYSGSDYGTNGFYFDFSNSADLGEDQGGNGSFTLFNIDSAHQYIDTPTENYAVWDLPARASSALVGEGGIWVDVSVSNPYTTYCSWDIKGQGKFYWEAHLLETLPASIRQLVTGVANIEKVQLQRTERTRSVTNNNEHRWWAGIDVTNSTQFKTVNDTVISTAVGRTWAVGDIIKIALDTDTGDMWIGVNNDWYDDNKGLTGDPENGLNPTLNCSGLDEFHPLIVRENRPVRGNFGQTPFAYTPPAGFKELKVSSLADPVIAKPTDYFAPVLYTGDGTVSRDITTVPFQPDWVWAKNRDASKSHQLMDSARGAADGVLLSNANSQAQAATSYSGGGLTALLANGFRVEDGTVDASNLNGSGNEIVAWNWKVDEQGAFAIDAYSGDSTASVAHSLGVEPEMIIIKRRTGTQNWTVWHKGIQNQDPVANMYLDTTGGGTTFVVNVDGGGIANAASHDANNVGLIAGISNVYQKVNQTGSDYVMMTFASVAGYSKVGQYVGNGNADGPFIYCGFRPAFVIVKRDANGFSWTIFDTKRSPPNPLDLLLYADATNVEAVATSRIIDALANGFKPRGTDTGVNANGGTYTFFAFAEYPFKTARAA